MVADKIITEHANKRMHQLGIREEDIAFAIRRGRKKHSKGCIYYFVGKRDVDAEHNELNGLHVLVSCDKQNIITTYKNRTPTW